MIGQILVINDKTDPKVEVKFLPEGFGICSFSFDYDKNDEKTIDEKFEMADKCFDALTLSTLESAIGDMISQMMD